MVFVIIASGNGATGGGGSSLVYDLLTIGAYTAGTADTYDRFGGPFRMSNDEIADVRMSTDEGGQNVFGLVRYAASGMSVSSTLKSNTTTALGPATTFSTLVTAANSDVSQIAAATNTSLAFWDAQQGAFIAVDFPTSGQAFFLEFLDSHDFGETYDSVLAVVRTDNTLIYGRLVGDDTVNLLSTLADSTLTFNSNPEAMCLMTDGVWGIEPAVVGSNFTIKTQRFDANGWGSVKESATLTAAFGTPSNFKVLALNPILNLGLVSWAETSGAEVRFFAQVFDFDQTDGMVSASNKMTLGTRPDTQWPNDLHWVRIDNERAAFTRYVDGDNDYYTEVVLAGDVLAIVHDADAIPEDTGIPATGGGIEGTSKTWDDGLILQTDRNGLRVIQVYREEISGGDTWVFDLENLYAYAYHADAFSALNAWDSGPFKMENGDIVYGYTYDDGTTQPIFRLTKFAPDGSELEYIDSAPLALSYREGSHVAAISPDGKKIAVQTGDSLGIYDQDSGDWATVNTASAGISATAGKALWRNNVLVIITWSECAWFSRSGSTVTQLASPEDPIGGPGLQFQSVIKTNELIYAIGHDAVGGTHIRYKSRYFFAEQTWEAAIFSSDYAYADVADISGFKVYSLGTESRALATWVIYDGTTYKRAFQMITVTPISVVVVSDIVHVTEVIGSGVTVTGAPALAMISDDRIAYVFGANAAGPDLEPTRYVEIEWSGGTLNVREDVIPIPYATTFPASADSIGNHSLSAGYDASTGDMYVAGDNGVRKIQVYRRV